MSVSLRTWTFRGSSCHFYFCNIMVVFFSCSKVWVLVSLKLRGCRNYAFSRSIRILHFPDGLFAKFLAFLAVSLALRVSELTPFSLVSEWNAHGVPLVEIKLGLGELYRFSEHWSYASGLAGRETILFSFPGDSSVLRANCRSLCCYSKFTIK